MEMFPRARKEVMVKGDPDRLSACLVSLFPKHGIMVQQHYPGSRVVGTAFRPLSLAWGQEIRVDFRPMDGGEVEAILESRFQVPWVDFSHENDKNITLVEQLVTEAASTAAAGATC